MGVKEEEKQSDGGGNHDANACSVDSQKLSTVHSSNNSIDKEADVLLCRVCQCSESDRRGDAALGFLDILPPPQETSDGIDDGDSTQKVRKIDVEKDVIHDNDEIGPGFVEFISPEGEVFVCSTDIESGSYCQQDALIDLGCSCKNELALAHYACALKWFVSHGSTICEICATVAKNIRPADFKKIMASLKEYEALKERTATGELTQVHVETNSGVDPDALAAVRRQRLSEVSLWFNPHNNSVTVSQETIDQSTSVPPENVATVENPTTKWAVEGIGILVATGLLMVTLAWLIAPHVGKVWFKLIP